MKVLLASLSFTLFCYCAVAQGIQILDTTVYEVPEKPPYPLFKSCMPVHGKDWNADSIRRCGEMQLLSVLSANIRYPEEARQKNIQGTVVLSFIVEPANGRISSVRLLKDIGGGCGAEAIRVLKALDSLGLRWAHATQDGKDVRARHSIPLRFKIQEALPYFLTENGDTIYSDYDTPPQFKAGIDSLIYFVFNQLDYPKPWEDSCKTGVFEMALLVRPNGAIQVEKVLDFNNLGLDFQWEAMRVANRMKGQWDPAVYNGKPVPATTPLRVVFKSEAKGCKAANDRFDRAMILADEGTTLMNAEKNEEAIKKWSEALALHPDNSELLYYRGTALINLNRRDEACKDYNRVKQIMGITWFEDVRKLVCGW